MDKYDDYLNGKKQFIGDLVEYNSELEFQYYKGKIIISGNKEGLLTLAKHLIDFAYDEHRIYPGDLHMRPSNYTIEELNNNSKHVYIKKIDEDN